MLMNQRCEFSLAPPLQKDDRWMKELWLVQAVLDIAAEAFYEMVCKTTQSSLSVNL